MPGFVGSRLFGARPPIAASERGYPPVCPPGYVHQVCVTCGHAREMHRERGGPRGICCDELDPCEFFHNHPADSGHARAADCPEALMLLPETHPARHAAARRTPLANIGSAL